jgi:hypothetical protein
MDITYLHWLQSLLHRFLHTNEERSMKDKEPPLEEHTRASLLNTVRKTWIDGVLTKSLHEKESIVLNLQNRPDVLVNPWDSQVQETRVAPGLLPREMSIVQVYDQDDRGLL